MRVRNLLLLTLGVAVTTLVVVGTVTSGSPVLPLVIPGFLGLATALLAWLGVLYVRQRRIGLPWPRRRSAAVLADVLLMGTVAGFLFPRLPAIAILTAACTAIATFVALTVMAAPEFGWDQDARW